MHETALILGSLCILAWLYLLLGRGRFWVVPRLKFESHELAAGASQGIAVVVPARNEADVIGFAVRSLLQQTWTGPLHVFVVDDNSSDHTSEVARKAATSSPHPEALSVIAGKPLPPGWSGKVWAMQQGIEAALAMQPEYLLLTDADVHHSPENLATLVSVAESGGYDLASLMVKLHCRSVAEKLPIPTFVFFFFMLYPPGWIRDPRRRTAGAAGGCMLIRPESLFRAGGLGAIRSAIIDDCALAALVKRSGGRLWLGVTSDTRSMRSYRWFGEIEQLIARTAFNQLRHSMWLLAGAVLGLGLAYLLPVALLFTGVAMLMALGAVAWLAMSTAYLPMVRFYALSPLWALTLPLSAAFYMLATMHSAWKYWSGSGGEWKGRAQDAA